MHIIFCSGAEHLKDKFNQFKTHSSSFNYDGRRFFPNSDVYTRLEELEEFQGEDVIIIQSCNASSSHEQEQWTTADRFFELLQVLHLLTKPVKVREVGHKKFEENELEKPASIHVVLTCMPAGKQDHAVMTGEAVSTVMCLELIKQFSSSIVIIDPHPPMDFPFMQELGIERLTLVPDLIKKVKNLYKMESPIMLTADEYGQQRMGLAGLGKKRTSSSEVEITGTIDIKNKDVIFVDDAFFSGSTLLKTIKKYKELGAASVTPCIVHICPFAKKGEEMLERAFDELERRLIFSNTVWTKLGEEVATLVDCSPLIKEWIANRHLSTKE
ncbi:MAG: hypothetical protein ACXAEU_08725 [Candidatus Hodarchaeales archaeon]|jgi:phosphoribosylpyrophosphate synthetase